MSVSSQEPRQVLNTPKEQVLPLPPTQRLGHLSVSQFIVTFTLKIMVYYVRSRFLWQIGSQKPFGQIWCGETCTTHRAANCYNFGVECYDFAVIATLNSTLRSNTKWQACKMFNHRSTINNEHSTSSRVPMVANQSVMTDWGCPRDLLCQSWISLQAFAFPVTLWANCEFD